MNPSRMSYLPGKASNYTGKYKRKKQQENYETRISQYISGSHQCKMSQFAIKRNRHGKQIKKQDPSVCSIKETYDITFCAVGILFRKFLPRSMSPKVSPILSSSRFFVLSLYIGVHPFKFCTTRGRGM